MGMIYKRGNKWWVKYYRAGKPFYESTRSTKKKTAQDLLRRREGEITDGRFVGTHADKVRFEGMGENLLNDYKANGRRSLPGVQRTVKRLTEFFGGRRAVEITTADVRGYIAQRQEEKAAAATIMNDLAALKRMFNLALQAGEIHHKPYIPRVRVDNARKGFLGDIEYLIVREALPRVLQPVLDFAYWTAWRKQEILGLTWDRVDLAAGTARLDTSKNYSGRVVVLPESLKATLQRVQEETLALQARTGWRIPWVFHRSGKPIKSFDGAWRAARQTAGLPGLFFHDLRRTGVRNMIRAGVPERVAMAISGHKTRAMFDRYNIVNETDLQEAARKIGDHVRAPESVTENVTVPLRPGQIPPYSSQDITGEGEKLSP